MTSLLSILKTYVLGHWRVMSLAAAATIAVLTPLNALIVLIYVTILQFVLGEMTGGLEAVKAGGFSLSNFPRGFDLSQWGDFLKTMLGAYSAEYDKLTVVAVIGCIYLATSFVLKGLELWTTLALWRMRCNIIDHLVHDLFHHVCNLSMEYFNRSQVGDLTNRVSANAQNLASGCYSLAQTVVLSVPVAVLYWAVLSYTSPLLTAFAIGIFGVYILVTYLISKRLRDNIIRTTESLGKLTAWLHEFLSGIFLIKIFATEPYERGRFSELMGDHIHHTYKLGFYKRILEVADGYIQSMTIILLVIGGMALIVSNAIPAETFVVFILVLSRVQGPTAAVIQVINQWMSIRGTGKRVIEVFEERAVIEDGREKVAGFKDDITFHDVDFAYGPNGRVVNGVNLTLRKGEKVALVGHSGAGKSTIINLLLRLYDPQNGTITLDGEDIRHFTQASYRRLFGVVTQDPILFNKSILDNIAYAAQMDDVPDENVIKASKAAHADGFIKELKDGYGSMVGDRGLKLSGGQKQRLTLARAILRDSPILVLDEPTSSLDSQSETIIQEAMDEFGKDRTIVIVSHRLSTVRDADRILVFDHGRVVEDGNHDELMARKGTYARLFEMQA